MASIVWATLASWFSKQSPGSLVTAEFFSSSFLAHEPITLT
jgi:hypothetical protein